VTASAARDRGQLLALVAMAAGVFLIANDFTALSVAIPGIEQEFGASLGTAQWVVCGYTVIFGVLIVTGGRLADLYGRRLIFVIGAIIFGSFSIVGALSPDIRVLIASRALMGIGGALMWPAILGMTYAILPKEKAGLAGGLILGVAGLGNAFGPLLGGVLTDTVGWPALFLVNVPITVIAVWITLRNVPESQAATSERRIDVLGIATLSAGVIALLVALDQGAAVGWTDAPIIALFVVGVVLLVAFAAVERRQGEAALVPMSVIESRQFGFAALITLLVSAIFFSAVLFLPQLMEKELGFSAIEAGAGLLPLMIAFAATSFVAGPLYGRLGARVVVSAGAAALAVGMILLAAVTESATFVELVPGMLVVGVGIGLFYSSVTTAAVTALDPSRSSLAGGIVYMCQIAGGSVGLGINTAIVVGAATLGAGIALAFIVDAVLAAVATVVAILTIRSAPEAEGHARVRAYHRAHAP
jgi:EmrB/QacA subfamily drug resistance transporter